MIQDDLRPVAGLASIAEIRTVSRPHCMLCGRPGEPLHENLRDRLFGAVGSWRLARCSNPRCRLVWLDPMPVAEDIGNAYQGYYTHDHRIAGESKGFLNRAYHGIKRGYLASRYGYGGDSKRGVLGRLGWLLYLFPIRRSAVDDQVRRLGAHPGGRLLDIGCGSGDWLAGMRDLGWQVRGLDFDAEAVAAAASRGLPIDHGPLEEQRYPDASFDAVTLNHVIEHLPDPLGTLAECRRILRPGGRLMVFTPNSDGLGHLIFKAAWRGLEPPRHLYLFSPTSMRAVLARAGFGDFDVRTVNSAYMWRHSLGLRVRHADARRPLPFYIRTVSLALALVAQAILIMRPDAGECLAVRAVKG